MTPIDVAAARAATPFCDDHIHLNNAGTALPPGVVLDTQVEWLRTEARVGGYELEADRTDRIAAVYDSIARLLGADADDIGLFVNATDAWNAAFDSIPMGAGDRIITSETDYASNWIAFLGAQRRSGVTIDAIPRGDDGSVSLPDLANRLDDDVALVAISHIPTNDGLVVDAAAIGALCREIEAPFLLDACQSAGQVPLDVAALGCDFLSATGRKYLRGPRGTGFLYASPAARERFEPRRLDLTSATWTTPTTYQPRADGRRFETFERSQAGIVALGAAVEHALSWGLDAIDHRVSMLGERLRGQLRDIGATVHDHGTRRCGIVTFTLDDVGPDAVRDRLRPEGVTVWVSAATALDIDRIRRPDTVRASVHYYNTEDELDRAVHLLADL
ncbi:MAG: aminotransferase class V-fold PLP-dependent enzyme [Acidimicrobiia bacterium]|nr:aminotransferase class V-fold PLP-dependent enzyme [Acidimicrobiia bacterium]